MRQKMHEIIATSNKMGHPDIFLTMTCNPNWPEIRTSLLPGQSSQDRPNLCARVFDLKLKAVMEAVIKDKIFGEVLAYVRVIELQKRGLPHAHCIFILDQASKNALRNPARVDTAISAELPPEDDDGLREFSTWYTTRADHIILPHCAWETGGARKSFPSLFDPRHNSLKATNIYRTGDGVQKRVVRRQRDPCEGTLSRRLTTLWVLRTTRS